MLQSWMSQSWMSQSVFAVTIGYETAYWVLAIAGTVLFVIKILMVMLGGDVGGDGDGGGIDSTGVFAIFSLQSMLAFFMGAGWMGLAALKEWETTKLTAFLASIGFGTLLMLLNAVLMYGVNKLNSEPRHDLSDAMGHIGKVYLEIPAKGQGTGQVEVTASGRRQVLRAVSEGDAIPTGTLVQIADVRDGQILVVRPQG